MRYKVGDYVVVRRDLANDGTVYYSDDRKTSDTAVRLMVALAGHTVRIRECVSGKYRIDGFPWVWTDEMFECLEDEPIPIDGDDGLFSMLFGQCACAE